MDILDLLRADGSIVVNKKLARKIGLNEAVILSELISRFKWHQSKGEDKSDWFYCTKDTLEEQTSLNRYYQDKAINSLKELGLIDKKTTGMPARRYFKIITKKVLELIDGKFGTISQSRSSNSPKQDSKRVANKNVRESQEVISTNNTNNNIYNIWDEKMGTMIPANQKQTLATYLDELPMEVIKVAMQRTKDNCSKKGYFPYCKKILDNWVEEGVQELSDIDKLDDKHNGKVQEKPKRESDKRKSDYTVEDLEGLWDD